MLFDFKLTGITPLLVHADDVELSDTLTAWRKDTKNKNLSVPGDDRSPAWTWKTYCYSNGEHLTVPTDNLMASLLKAGAEIRLKGTTTFKSVTQSGLAMLTEHLPIEVNGKRIPSEAIEAIEGDFSEHAEAVKKHGFKLFVKRAKVGQSKHIRVRPRFDNWSLSGQIKVTAVEITPSALEQLFQIAGNSKGLCDWRPSAPKGPGPFGRFTVELKKVK